MTLEGAETETACAVLMGDLVASEKAGSPIALHELFNRAIAHQNREAKADILSPLTITLGDEFQGLVRTMTAGLPIMQKLRFELLQNGLECRFALGASKLQTPVNRKRAWNMMGVGLAATREKLNEKKTETLYRFYVPGNRASEAALEALGAGLTSIERRWTPQQLHDIAGLMSGKSVQEIARYRNVSAHSVYKVRSSGDFDLYLLQWNAIAEVLEDLDRELGLGA